jgi:hypothetical protein
MEIVGRFPSADEAESYQISQESPVWLPAGNVPLDEDVKIKIVQLRELSFKLNVELTLKDRARASLNHC